MNIAFLQHNPAMSRACPWCEGENPEHEDSNWDAEGHAADCPAKPFLEVAA